MLPRAQQLQALHNRLRFPEGLDLGVEQLVEAAGTPLKAGWSENQFWKSLLKPGC